jgi:hypothetical protein
MKSWCKIKLELAAVTLCQVFMPLFLFYRIVGGFSIRVAKMAMDGR